MMLDDDFGASDDECMEFSLDTMEEVVETSGKVIDFCLAHGIDHKTSMHTGLCVEEMVGNVIQQVLTWAASTLWNAESSRAIR